MDFIFNQNLILENDRVRLEPLDWIHFESLLPIAEAHPSLLQYSPVKFGDEAALKEIIESAYKERDQETRFAFAIFDKEKKQFAGSTSCGNVSNKNQRFEIGWTWLGKRFQRTGLNRNCKFLILQYGFEELGFERIELKTDSRNEQSKTAILAIGAKYEGTLRSHTLMIDGYRRHTAYYSIIKSEWPEVKDRIFKNYF